MIDDYSMNILQEHENAKRKREEERIRLWKKLTPSQKHLTLMYMYRLETDMGNINDYIETSRFIKTGICFDDLPTYLCRLTTDELYREAYEVIGAKMPEKKNEKTKVLQGLSQVSI